MVFIDITHMPKAQRTYFTLDIANKALRFSDRDSWIADGGAMCIMGKQIFADSPLPLGSMFGAIGGYIPLILGQDLGRIVLRISRAYHFFRCSFLLMDSITISVSAMVFVILK